MTTPIDPVEYWKLRALTAELDAAQAALALAQTRIELARTKRAACWAALTAQYDLDPARQYGALDESCSLLLVES